MSLRTKLLFRSIHATSFPTPTCQFLEKRVKEDQKHSMTTIRVLQSSPSPSSTQSITLRWASIKFMGQNGHTYGRQRTHSQPFDMSSHHVCSWVLHAHICPSKISIFQVKFHQLEHSPAPSPMVPSSAEHSKLYGTWLLHVAIAVNS